MSSLELICTLRQRLLISIEKHNVPELNRLHETFAALREIAHTASELGLVDALTDLEYAAGYGVIGATDRAMHLIPSEAAIRALFSSASASV